MNLRHLFASVVVVAMTSSAAAQDIIDWGEVIPGEVYSYSYRTPVQGYYTPDESGIMTCYISGDVVHVYSDAAHESIIEHTKQFYGANGDKVMIYTVEKGQTVYFYNSFPMNDGTFRFSVGSEDITVSDLYPSTDEGRLSLSSNYRASIMFNIPVKCSKCVLAVNDESVEITPEIIDSTVILNWFATLRQWYRDGRISEGDLLTVTLSGIRDANDSSNRPDFGDGVGKLVLRYTMAGRPVELVREVGTPAAGMTDLLTYYLPNGSDGLVSLIFSGTLDPNCKPVAELQYGDMDNIEAGMYYEYPLVNIDGNKLTVDLRGVTRFPDQLIPGLPAQSNISLRVSSIKSEDGQYVLTGSMASPYSFGYSYRLKSVVYSLAADWMPLAGSPLAEGTQMEIWVLNGTHMEFDSVDFSFVRDGVPASVSVPYSELKVENDPYDSEALLFYLSAPAIDADADSDIEVTLGGLKCADGLDHSSDILVRYKSASTGVGEITLSPDDAIFYDLTGRRVLNPSKGIYIHNGKKLIVR